CRRRSWRSGRRRGSSRPRTRRAAYWRSTRRRCTRRRKGRSQGDFARTTPNGRVLQPEGLRHDSPGQRPGSRVDQVKALKGRDSDAIERADVLPFQGLAATSRVPRALPWAVLCCPFGAEFGLHRRANMRSVFVVVALFIAVLSFAVPASAQIASLDVVQTLKG